MATFRYRTISLILSAALAASLCACSSGGPESISTNPHASETPATETPATSTETTTETTSVDFITEPSATTSLADTDFVRIVEGVDPQMMNADYWISEEDNEILMDADQIAAFNYANRVHQKTGDGVHTNASSAATDALRPFTSAAAASSRRRMRSTVSWKRGMTGCSFGSGMSARAFWNAANAPAASSAWAGSDMTSTDE